MNDDLKVKAQANLEWAQGRAKTYQEDGAPVPEPIRRLLELSTAATASDPGVGSEGSAKVSEAWQRATGCQSPEDVKRAIDDLKRKALVNGDALSILRDGAMWFAKSAAGLSGRTIFEELEQLRIGLSVVEPARSHVSEGPGATFQDAREGMPAPAPIVERMGWSLRPGLVLVKRGEPGRRVLFSGEPGRIFCQTITASGDLGPMTPTRDDDSWFTDMWDEGPAYVAPKKGDQVTIPGSGPEPGSAPAEKQPTIAEWEPTPVQIAQFVTSIGNSMTKKGLTTTVDEPLVRSLVDRFRKERGAESTQKPGVVFFHFAVSNLAGGT